MVNDGIRSEAGFTVWKIVGVERTKQAQFGYLSSTDEGWYACISVIKED